MREKAYPKTLFSLLQIIQELGFLLLNFFRSIVIYVIHTLAQSIQYQHDIIQLIYNIRINRDKVTRIACCNISCQLNPIDHQKSTATEDPLNKQISWFSVVSQLISSFKLTLMTLCILLYLLLETYQLDILISIDLQNQRICHFNFTRCNYKVYFDYSSNRSTKKIFGDFSLLFRLYGNLYFSSSFLTLNAKEIEIDWCHQHLFSILQSIFDIFIFILMDSSYRRDYPLKKSSYSSIITSNIKTLNLVGHNDYCPTSWYFLYSKLISTQHKKSDISSSFSSFLYYQYLDSQNEDSLKRLLISVMQFSWINYIVSNCYCTQINIQDTLVDISSTNKCILTHIELYPYHIKTPTASGPSSTSIIIFKSHFFLVHEYFFNFDCNIESFLFEMKNPDDSALDIQLKQLTLLQRCFQDQNDSVRLSLVGHCSDFEIKLTKQETVKIQKNIINPFLPFLQTILRKYILMMDHFEFNSKRFNSSIIL